MMAGTGIAIQSSRGRGTWWVERPGRGWGPPRSGCRRPVRRRPRCAAAGRWRRFPTPPVSRSSWHRVRVEAASDLPRRVPAGHVVVEDAPHPGRFGLVDLQARRPVLAAGQSPIAVGRLPRDHFAGPGPPQFPPPVALRDLGPLVFGDDTLDLGQQPGLGIVVEGEGIGEQDRHAVAGQFVQHDHLVGVDPGETVRRWTPHGIDETGFSGVTHAVEAWPVKAGAGETVVEKLAHHVVALSGGPLAQHRHLRTDRPPRFLRFGLHPGV